MTLRGYIPYSSHTPPYNVWFTLGYYTTPLQETYQSTGRSWVTQLELSRFDYPDVWETIHAGTGIRFKGYNVEGEFRLTMEYAHGNASLTIETDGFVRTYEPLPVSISHVDHVSIWANDDPWFLYYARVVDLESGMNILEIDPSTALPSQTLFNNITTLQPWTYSQSFTHFAPIVSSVFEERPPPPSPPLSPP